MSCSYDVVVVGLAAMGSAVVYQLAKAGARVLGINRFAPPHVHGSSHGDSRITRLALGEGAAYVPLAIRSHALWREIEALTGEALYRHRRRRDLRPGGRGQHGADDFLATTITTARAHGIAHEVLDGAALAERFPAVRAGRRRARHVRAERRLRQAPSRRRRATALGARASARASEPASGSFRPADAVSSPMPGRTPQRRSCWPLVPGSSSCAPSSLRRSPCRGRCCTGSSSRPAPTRPTATCPSSSGSPETVPEEFFYGFPAIDGPDGGLKVASEQFQATTTPAACRREVTAEESRQLHARFLARRLPGLRARTVKATTCLYTSTADSGFAIGAHPGDADLLVVSPCSGHGFKHSAAIGEAVAQLALTGQSAIDLHPFGLNRPDVVR